MGDSSDYLQGPGEVEAYINSASDYEKISFQNRWNIDADLKAQSIAAGIPAPANFWDIASASPDAIAARRKILKEYWTVDQIGRYDTQRCRNYTEVRRCAAH